MGDEQKQILRMVADGKVTPDEGARLLEALEKGERKRREQDSPARMAREKKRLIMERGMEMEERSRLRKHDGLEGLKDIGRMVKTAIAESLPGIFHDDDLGPDPIDGPDGDSQLLEGPLDLEPGSKLKISRRKIRNAGGSLFLTGSDGNTLETVGTDAPEVRYSVDGDTVHLSWSRDDLSLAVPRSVARVSVGLMAGDLVVSDLPSELRLKTSGGNLGLYDVSGEFSAKTMGGDVIIRLSGEWSEDSRASTMGGNISLSIPRDTDALISARTMGGEILVEDGMEFRKENGHYGSSAVSIDLTDGGEAPEMRMKTMGGDISVAFADDGQDMDSGKEDEKSDEAGGKNGRKRGKK